MSYEIKDGKKVYVQNLYIQKDYDELFKGLLNEAYDNSLISHNEKFLDYIGNKNDISSFYVMTLSILADSIEDVYYDMSDVYYSDKIEYALGRDLDEIGNKIGCPRPQATKAGVQLTFKLNTSFDFTFKLPSNIFVSTNTGITYATTEVIDVPIGETTVYAYALAVQSGRRSRVSKDTLRVINSDVVLEDGTVVSMSVNNDASSTGGRDVYNDEEYRELLLDWVKNNIKGSKEAYERYFATVDGLDSYRLVPNWNGITGTVKVVLDPGHPYQLRQCYNELTGTVLQFSEDVVMFPPDYVPIDIYAVCDVDIDVLNPYSSVEKESIKTRIEDAIRIYIDGDLYSKDRKEHIGLELGEDFIPYKLGIYINKKVPELKNIGFKYPTTPVKISDEQMCKSNDIKIEMGNVSDYYNEWDTNNDKETDYIGWKI